MLRLTRLPMSRQIGGLGFTLARTVIKKGAVSDCIAQNSEEFDDYVQEWSFPFPAQASFHTKDSHEKKNYPERALRPVSHGLNRNVPDGVLPQRL